jgi:hypothetical protein
MHHIRDRALRQRAIARKLGYAFAFVLVLALLVVGSSAMVTPPDIAVPPIRFTPPTSAPANDNLPSVPVFSTEERDDGYIGSYGG